MIDMFKFKTILKIVLCYKVHSCVRVECLSRNIPREDSLYDHIIDNDFKNIFNKRIKIKGIF